MKNKFTYNIEQCEIKEKKFNEGVKYFLNKALVLTAFVSSLLITNANAEVSNNKQYDLNIGHDGSGLKKYNNILSALKSKQINNTDTTDNILNDLNNVNKSINTFKYVSDMKNYGKEDYYASPAEMIAKKSGDCEDFAMLKYHVLVNELGYDKSKLNFHYGQNDKGVPHIVLAYELSKGKEIVLDSGSNVLTLLGDKDCKFESMFSINNNNTMTLEGNIKSMAKDSNFSNLYSKTNLAYVKNEIERLDNVREIASLSF